MPSRTAEALFSGIVDYAGLFPPAKLEMAATVAEYARYRAGAQRWMLGRLVVPVSRLGEFEGCAAGAGGLLAGASEDDPVRISGLSGGVEGLSRDIDAIFAFNNRHTDGESGLGRVVVDVVELKCSSAGEVDRAMRVIPEQVDPFIEIPVSGDPRGLIAAIAGTGARAKIRTGGVTADAIPSVEDVARFIWCCGMAEVAFKATAGLHHAVRAERALTYEKDAPRAVMHGFVNVFIAAALVRALRLSEVELREVIAEMDPSAFFFTGESAGWRGLAVDAGRLAHAREAFAIGFGSCSFEEPVGELGEMRVV